MVQPEHLSQIDLARVSEYFRRHHPSHDRATPQRPARSRSSVIPDPVQHAGERADDPFAQLFAQRAGVLVIVARQDEVGFGMERMRWVLQDVEKILEMENVRRAIGSHEWTLGNSPKLVTLGVRAGCAFVQDGQLRARIDVEFAEGDLQVKADRMLADFEPFSDLFILQALTDQRGDLALPRRKSYHAF